MKKIKMMFLSLILAVATAFCAMAEEDQHPHEGLNGLLWMQTSAEYRALTTQAYQRARYSIERALADPSWTVAIEQDGRNFKNLPPAIISDIDETVLDTSAFQAQLILERKQFNEPLWEAWVKTASAESVPGAQEFLKWCAEEKKITVFYITNRDVSVEPYTRKNLRDKGFPVAEAIDVILSRGENGSPSSDKSHRRRLVCEGYRVLLLAGDHLGDFISVTKKSPESRVKAAGLYDSFWGDKWIIMPNPLYGSWERALYDYEENLTDRQILKKKFERLQGFR